MSTKFNVAIIDGTQNQIQRNITINDTTNQILLIQVYAGSVGLNLQHYNHIHFTSPRKSQYRVTGYRTCTSYWSEISCKHSLLHI